MLHPVILAGGVGARLWPLSRKSGPKPLIPLLSSQTLFQETILRLDGLDRTAEGPVGAPTVVCNRDHRFLVGEQLQELGVAPEVVMLEPAVRNTAPAVAAAALYLAGRDPDAVLLLLAADFAIQDTGAFHAAIGEAVAAARQGLICTFGIVPERPETGYGYIHAGDPLPGGARKVRRFVEKPDAATAQQMLASGEYLWNSGMFVARADVLLEELARFAPAVLECAGAAVRAARRDEDFLRLGEAEFAAAPALSIDHAVMEPTERAAVVPADIGWSDLGTWESVWAAQPHDAERNVTSGDTLLVDVRGCLVRAESRLVAALGVENLAILETEDAVLVVPLDRSQDVKRLVDAAQALGRPEL